MLTAQQEAQKFIINLYGRWKADTLLQQINSPEQIEQYWSQLNDEDELRDARNEARHHGEEVSGIKTRIHYSWERNFEVCVRVIPLDNERGLAYNYVTGGGKHGEPDSHEWWAEAWFVTCTGTETIVKRTYADIPEEPQTK